VAKAKEVVAENGGLLEVMRSKDVVVVARAKAEETKAKARANRKARAKASCKSFWNRKRPTSEN